MFIIKMKSFSSSLKAYFILYFTLLLLIQILSLNKEFSSSSSLMYLKSLKLKQHRYHNSQNIIDKNSSKILNSNIISNSTANITSNKYDTFSYEKLMVDLLNLSENNLDLLELKNNIDYGIEFPEGSCGKNKCHIVVAKLTNRNNTMKSIKKSKLLINCGQNGMDNISPIVCYEYIKTILESKSNDWINYLMNACEIYVIPILNPFGFYLNNKEEFYPSKDNFLNEINMNFNYDSTNKNRNDEGVATSFIKKLLSMNKFNFVVSLDIFDKDIITFPWRTLEKSNIYEIMIKNKQIIDNIKDLNITNLGSYNETEFNSSNFEDLENVDEEEIFDNNFDRKRKILIDIFNNIDISPYYTFPTKDDNLFNRIAKIISKISSNYYVKKYSSLTLNFKKILYGKKSLFFPPNKGDMDDWIYKNHNETLPFSIFINVNNLNNTDMLGLNNNFCILNSFNNPFYYIYNNRPSEILNCIHDIGEKRNIISEEIINDMYKNYQVDSLILNKDEIFSKNERKNYYSSNGIIPNYVRSLMLFSDMLKEYIVINKILLTEKFQFSIEFSLGGFINKPICKLSFDYLIDNDMKFEKYRSGNIDEFSTFSIQDSKIKFDFKNSMTLNNVKYNWDTNKIYNTRNTIDIDYLTLSSGNKPNNDQINTVFVFKLLCGYMDSFKSNTTSLIFYYK